MELRSPTGKDNFWEWSGPLKSIESLCCGVRSKMNHSILNNSTCDAAFCQNSLTTRSVIQLFPLRFFGHVAGADSKQDHAESLMRRFDHRFFMGDDLQDIHVSPAEEDQRRCTIGQHSRDPISQKDCALWRRIIDKVTCINHGGRGPIIWRR